MPLRATAILILVLAAVAACMGPVAPPTPANSPGIPTPSPSPKPSTNAPSGGAPADGPPAARLAAEGGDAVTGQLGTYVWGDAGSDSPWLPGAPISVGAGEPLAVTFDPPTTVAGWRARMVASDADGPDGARVLGEGAGEPSFQAPEAGSWTVEVHVGFDSGAGDASYFWRLDVR